MDHEVEVGWGVEENTPVCLDWPAAEETDFFVHGFGRARESRAGPSGGRGLYKKHRTSVKRRQGRRDCK